METRMPMEFYQGRPLEPEVLEAIPHLVAKLPPEDIDT